MEYRDPEDTGDGSDQERAAEQPKPYEPIYAGEGEPLVRPSYEPPPPAPTRKIRRLEKPLGEPMRLVFGDMSGAFFLVFIPVLFAFFFPWNLWLPNIAVAKGLTVRHLALACTIAIFPWIVLTLHLARGRLWDGILDMFLWAIWECGIMITLCYLYPHRAEAVLYNAAAYWDDMQSWLITGHGTEGTISAWFPIHLRHLVLIHIGAFLIGLPGLVLGVLQLNFMNYYVSRCMLAATDPLRTLPVAWHFWSVIRVLGFITIASAIYQVFLRLIFRVPARWGWIWGAWFSGMIFVVLDALLKWRFAETVRMMLRSLCNF
jgi:hypothetical protein